MTPQKFIISLASRVQRVVERREESNEISKEHLGGSPAKCYYIPFNPVVGIPDKMQDTQ